MDAKEFEGRLFDLIGHAQEGRLAPAVVAIALEAAADGVRAKHRVPRPTAPPAEIREPERPRKPRVPRSKPKAADGAEG